MKLLFVLDSPGFGGTEQGLVHLVKGLIAENVHCEVVTSQSILARRTEALNVPTHIISFDDLLSASAVVRKVCKGGYDTVHALRWKGILAAATAIRGIPIPLVCGVQSLFEPGTRWLKDEAKSVNHLPLILSHSATRVIAVSQAVKASLVVHGVKADIVEVIYAGFPHPLDGYQIQKYHSHIVGYTGRLSPEKGPDLLLLAAALLKKRAPDLSFQLCFIGDGPQQLALKDYAQRLELTDQCQFVGFLPNPYPDMTHFRLLAVPSRQDGLPLAMLEAMSIGLPIVAFAVGGIPEAVNNGKNGLLIAPDQLDDFACGLEQLLRNSALCRQLGGKGRQMWEQQFSFSKYVEQHLALYRSMVSTQ